MIGLLVGGAASGVGKTTVTLALIACMRRRGLTVQAFKGGPDFLDTTHHTRMSGRPARNIDTWMLDAAANSDVLRGAARGADALIAEGMMGLFDGKSGATEAGSSAEMAKLLHLPVVLVLDCAKSARSAAAVVHGFEAFDPELPLAGVILNRVAGERHYDLLRLAIEARCQTPVLGWLPHEPAIAIPERHLGLHGATQLRSASDAALLELEMDRLAQLAEQHLAIDRILALRCGLNLDLDPDRTNDPQAQAQTQPAAGAGLRIGVARDAAFSFYYEDNLDLLRQTGAELLPFSPAHDRALPEALDALYLGGGYPELEAERLAANTTMLRQVREFAETGGVIYAECGGMIYLSQTLTTLDGRKHPMASVLPLHIAMTPRLVDFGYVEVTLTDDCLLGPHGTEIRGHSFHTSRIVEGAVDDIDDAPQAATSHAPSYKTSYRMRFSLSGKEQPEGFARGRVLASYVHLHFRANASIVPHLIAQIHAAQRPRTNRTNQGAQ